MLNWDLPKLVGCTLRPASYTNQGKFRANCDLAPGSNGMSRFDSAGNIVLAQLSVESYGAKVDGRHPVMQH